MRTLHFQFLFFEGKIKMLTDDRQQVMAIAQLDFYSSLAIKCKRFDKI